MVNRFKTEPWNCHYRDTVKPEQFINNIEQEQAEAFSNLFKKVLLPVDGQCYGMGARWNNIQTIHI